MRRPAAYAPLSVLFATGKTGVALQNRHGVEGIGVWACMIAAAKRAGGQIVFAHDQDWQAIGIFEPPAFTLGEFLKTTGQLKQTRCTRHGHVRYVVLTRYGEWNDDAYRERERQRKSRYSQESERNKSGRLAEHKRKQSASELELDLEVEEELTHSPRTTTTPASDDIDFQAADNGGAWTTELDIPRLGDAMPTLGVSD